jgi:hypothetical protein
MLGKLEPYHAPLAVAHLHAARASTGLPRVSTAPPRRVG